MNGMEPKPSCKNLIRVPVVTKCNLSLEANAVWSCSAATGQLGVSTGSIDRCMGSERQGSGGLGRGWLRWIRGNLSGAMCFHKWNLRILPCADEQVEILMSTKHVRNAYEIS
jgi:hypothetical protein